MKTKEIQVKVKYGKTEYGIHLAVTTMSSIMSISHNR